MNRCCAFGTAALACLVMRSLLPSSAARSRAAHRSRASSRVGARSACRQRVLVRMLRRAAPRRKATLEPERARTPRILVQGSDGCGWQGLSHLLRTGGEITNASCEVDEPVTKGRVWRRRKDSNLRTACTVGGFQNRCHRPLGHSSKSDNFWLSDTHHAANDPRR